MLPPMATTTRSNSSTASCSERFALGGVGADDLGEHAVERLHDLLVQVDAQHLGAPGHELERRGSCRTGRGR